MLCFVASWDQLTHLTVGTDPCLVCAVSPLLGVVSLSLATGIRGEVGRLGRLLNRSSSQALYVREEAAT